MYMGVTPRALIGDKSDNFASVLRNLRRVPSTPVYPICSCKYDYASSMLRHIEANSDTFLIARWTHALVNVRAGSPTHGLPVILHMHKTACRLITQSAALLRGSNRCFTFVNIIN